MSKHPTPKKKTPRSEGKIRYGAFVQKKLKKLRDIVLPLVGKHQGENLAPKAKVKKITKIEA